MKSKEISLAIEVIQHVIETLEKIERFEHRNKQNKSLKTAIHQLKDATRIIETTNKRNIDWIEQKFAAASCDRIKIKLLKFHMISLMALEDTLEEVNIGSKVKIYAEDFTMCSYIRYLGEQEEYDLVDCVEGDSSHMCLFVIKKLKEPIWTTRLKRNRSASLNTLRPFACLLLQPILAVLVLALAVLLMILALAVQFQF